MTSPAVRSAAEQRIRDELAVRLTHGHDAILRRIPDLYRRIIGEALRDEGVGKADQLRAAQRALDRIATIGVVDFVDSAGRRWSMQSYVEMAVRTAALRAMITAQMQVYRDRGITLVYVTRVQGQCELCRPYESALLAIDAVPALDEVDGRRIVDTVDGAIRAGLFHPSCRHQLRSWRPNRTVIPPPTPDPEAYAAQQELRHLERTLRGWRRRETAAMTPEAQRLAARKVAEWQAEIRRHVEDTGIRRDHGRENPERALTSPVPRAR